MGGCASSGPAVDTTPMIIDVQQTVADAAWHMFYHSRSRSVCMCFLCTCPQSALSVFLFHDQHCLFPSTGTVCFLVLFFSPPIATNNACLPVHVSTASNVCFPVFTIKLSVSCPCALVHSQVVRFPVHLSTTSTVFLSTCPQPALSVSLCTCPQPALSV